MSAGTTQRQQRRADMHGHCLWLLDKAGPEYAMTAADWYEANEPWHLDGLGKRIRADIEKRRLHDPDQ